MEYYMAQKHEYQRCKFCKHGINSFYAKEMVLCKLCGFYRKQDAYCCYFERDNKEVSNSSLGGHHFDGMQ